jgi:hypothetical protein
MPIIAVALLLLLAVVVMIPIGIIQRFRLGTAQRRARRWLATVNLVGVVASIAVLLLAAVITTRWVPGTLTYTLAGLATGCGLGVLGIILTRWEDRGGELHYTPNRWLVLVVTLVVALRLAYGFWRTWDAWRQSLENGAWVAASGAAGSMAAGAVVLGYYAVFWSGLRRAARPSSDRATERLRVRRR